MTDYVIASPNGTTWTIQSTNAAKDGRFHDLAFLMEGAAGAGNSFKTSRPGVLVGPPVAASSNTPGGFAVAASGGGLGFSIQPAAAVVERSTLVGSYLVDSTAVGTGAVGTADPSQTRVDRLDLQVLDGVLGDNGGVSKTSIKVSPGTPGAGLPAAPTNSDPIGSWSIPAGTTNLASATWTPARKSAGLRGAARVLLEGDALSDPGFMVAECRMRYHATYAKWLTDVWDASVSTWKGTQSLYPAAPAWQNGTSDITISASVRTNVLIATIPDPGWPYVLKVSAQLDWNGYGTFTAGAPRFTQLYATLDTNAGTLIGQSNGFAQVAAGGADAWSLLPVTPPTATLTGAHTVVLSAKGSVACIAPFSAIAAAATYLNVEIVPA